MKIIFFGYGKLTQSLIENFDSSLIRSELNLVTNQKVLLQRDVKIISKSIIDKNDLIDSILIVGYRNLKQLSELRIEIENFRACHLIIMLSSVSVFGEANIPAIDITPANPVNQYGLDKINLESYFKENLKDSKIFFLRISNLYGFTRSSGIVSYLLKQFLLKGPVDIDGGPSWVRNFVSFNFLKLAIERMITNQHKFSENHNWLNMASNWNIELSNLIHVICEELDWFPIINFSIENPNQIHTSQILPSDKLELLNLPAEHFNFFRNYIIKFKKTDSGKLFQW